MAVKVDGMLKLMNQITQIHSGTCITAEGYFGVSRQPSLPGFVVGNGIIGCVGTNVLYIDIISRRMA